MFFLNRSYKLTLEEVLSSVIYGCTDLLRSALLRGLCWIQINTQNFNPDHWCSLLEDAPTTECRSQSQSTVKGTNPRSSELRARKEKTTTQQTGICVS